MCYLIAIFPSKAMFLAFVKTHFFHLKNISILRPMLSMANAEMLIHVFMTSRLDYCNALLGGCSVRLINKLQLVQNAAARVLEPGSMTILAYLNKEPHIAAKSECKSVSASYIHYKTKILYNVMYKELGR